MQEQYHQFAYGLERIGAIKFGSFTLKSGGVSPIYVDLRLLRSHPEMLRAGANILHNLWEEGSHCDLIADVPTAATPLVAAMCVLHNIPMVSPRVPKGHGTNASVEGVYTPGMTVCLIDDLVTKATSKLPAIQTFQTSGLVVKEICVLVNREQGGKEELAKAGYKLRAAFTLRELMDLYANASTPLVTRAQYEKVIGYLDAEKPKTEETAPVAS